MTPTLPPSPATSSTRPRLFRSVLPGFGVALAAWAAAAALAHTQVDPAGAAETAHLALLASGALLALAVLAPPPSHELGMTALLVLTGTWIVGHGPHRGALLVLLLAAGLAVAVARAARRSPGPLGRPGTSVALALAVQWLTHGDLLLPPTADPATLGRLLGVPVLAGLVLHALARRFGERPAWIAGATAVALGPGFDLAFLARPGEAWEWLALALVLLPGVALLLPITTSLPAGAARRRLVFDLQFAWSNVLALGVILLAAYPWRREAALDDLLGIFGFEDLRLAALAAVLLVSGLGLALGRWPAFHAGTLLGGALLLALALAAPHTALLPVAFEPVRLDAQNNRFFYSFAAQPIAGGILDTHLVRGHDLAPGTPVALVLLRDEADHELGRFTIAAGQDTAEWAAARPDVAGRPGFVAPPPFLSKVAASGDFFIERFRFRFALEDRPETASVALRRHPDLPPETVLLVHRLELRR